MIIQRTKFFLLILALILAIFLTPKVVRSYTGIWGDTLVYGGIPT